MNRRTAHANRRARWTAAVLRASRRLDDLVGRSNAGHRLRMSEVYGLAHEFVKLGARGVKLREEVLPAEYVNAERVGAAIAARCDWIARCSGILEALAERQNIPLIDFPKFANILRTSSSIDASALLAIEKLKQQLEEEEKK